MNAVREQLRRRPWLLVIALVVLVLGFEAIFFWVAGATVGDEFEPLPEASRPAAAGALAPGADARRAR